MRYHTRLFILISILGLVSVCSAQQAEPAAAAITTAGDSTVYPYMAEVTGNDVYIRSGPGTYYYDCGKLFKGDKITIVGVKDGVWSQILPLADSYSWVSTLYVDIDPTDPTIGTITGDNVRVWAGSDSQRPEASTTLQGKLNKGAKVKLLGEEQSKYYKIAVPSLPDAYLWISTQYTKPIAPETNNTDTEPGTTDTTPGTDITPGTDETTPQANGGSGTVDSAGDNQGGSGTTTPKEETPLEKYYELQKQLDAERTKPINEQDYSTIKEALQELADNSAAGNVSRYAKAVIERIESYELALEVDNVLKLQNDQLKQTKEQIEKAHTERLKEVTNLGKYAVVGQLKQFYTPGSGHYLVVDESDPDHTLCYAVPAESLSNDNVDELIGKKVGLIGTIEPNVQTASAMVRFSQVDVLE